MAETQTEYRLSSSPEVYAPGIIKWAIAGYWNASDRKALRIVVTSTWRIPDRVATKLLSKEVPYSVEGDIVVFTA